MLSLCSISGRWMLYEYAAMGELYWWKNTEVFGKNKKSNIDRLLWRWGQQFAAWAKAQRWLSQNSQLPGWEVQLEPLDY